VSGITATGGIAIAVSADVAVVANIRRLFARVIEVFGQVEIVVNNAGPISAPKAVSEMTESDYDATLSGFCAWSILGNAGSRAPRVRRRKDYQYLQRDHRASSFFQFSLCGKQSRPGSFSSVLAAELAPRRITVNTVIPGAVETSMLRALPGELQRMLEPRTPLGLGQPQDIAELVGFLASDGARWLTNEKIRCDCGIR
jgi:3-oxoacyl-[acyl-carrier protein] reductase